MTDHIDTSTAAVEVEAAYVDSPSIAALLCALAAERDALKWRLDCIINETGQSFPADHSKRISD